MMVNICYNRAGGPACSTRARGMGRAGLRLRRKAATGCGAGRRRSHAWGGARQATGRAFNFFYLSEFHGVAFYS